ncbi:MAG: hypothetical protein V5B31_11205 [Candidatus Accumulibacter propinquus]|uniref:hypothetical protein n=1 Tax=Candidatus Accumulibacter propinquus TaxID=2954380 RepID=UPI002FC3AC44
MAQKEYVDDDIATVLSQYFTISHERALQDVANVVEYLKSASLKSHLEGYNDPNVLAIGEGKRDFTGSIHSDFEDCGNFLFGETEVKVSSQVAEIGQSFFSRFRHRAIGENGSAAILEISQGAFGYRLTFRGVVVEESSRVARILSRVAELLLDLEHQNMELLAYCHAAAVTRGNCSLLMPGNSGVGKSTLTGFLVAKGFSYLGDDITAIREDDGALLPLPSCLSVKSGAWPVLDQFFPVLRQLPTLNRYGRLVRYIEPQGNYESQEAAGAPSAIVFPSYKQDEPTCLAPVPALKAMIRLLGAHLALATPATEDKLRKLIRFVEQTPAYELTYSDLPSALKAIEDLLAAQPQQ